MCGTTPSDKGTWCYLGGNPPNTTAGMTQTQTLKEIQTLAPQLRMKNMGHHSQHTIPTTN